MNTTHPLIGPLASFDSIGRELVAAMQPGCGLAAPQFLVDLNERAKARDVATARLAEQPQGVAVDSELMLLAADFETCIPFLPEPGQRNIAKAVERLRVIASQAVAVVGDDLYPAWVDDAPELPPGTKLYAHAPPALTVSDEALERLIRAAETAAVAICNFMNAGIIGAGYQGCVDDVYAALAACKPARGAEGEGS